MRNTTTNMCVLTLGYVSCLGKRKLKSHGETGNSGGPTFDLNGQVSGIAIKASDGARGQHIFIMPVQPLNRLMQKNVK